MAVKAKAGKASRILSDFAGKFSFYIPEAHRNFLSQKDQEEFLQERFNFFGQRKDEIKIEVYNPGDKFLWLTNSSVIEVAMPDSPFIVDTIVDYCGANGHSINVIIHPIFNVERTDDGDLLSVNYPDGPGSPESYVYLEINYLKGKELTALKKQLLANLRELRRVVTDFDKMIAQIDKIGVDKSLAAKELVWLKDNFVLLGLARLTDDDLGPPYLGIFRSGTVRKDAVDEVAKNPHLCDASKTISFAETALRSNVNKNRQLYFASVKNGNKVLMAGHFRHSAETAQRDNVPYVHDMLETMADELRVPTRSYKRKELYKTAQVLPLGLLLTRTRSLLMKWFVKILSNLYTTEILYELSTDDYGLVWAEILVPAQDAGQVPGNSLDVFLKTNKIRTVHSIRNTLNRIEVVFLSFHSDELGPKQTLKLLEQNAGQFFSTWTSRFREMVIAENIGDQNIKEKLARYLDGISPDYKVHHEPFEAYCDLVQLENMVPEDGFCVRYAPQSDSGRDCIKVYSLSGAPLSRLIPVLTNFGFVIEDVHTYPYRQRDKVSYTHDFQIPREPNLKDEDRQRIAVCIEEVLNNALTSKPINELARIATLDRRELDLAKALCAYFFKIDSSLAFSTIQQVMLRYPGLTRELVDYFKLKFHPDSSDAEVAEARDGVEACFRELSSVVEENIAKTFLNIVDAIVRTNFHLNKAELSFKIDSGKIDNMPSPIPFREIYVYCHEMEGIHLRGGPVARGGIRWSDRPDDFRTEILGLMKAQMVKNTLIVPVGSKGGFVIKNRSFSDRREMLAAGVDAYKRYIASLLDLTDNLAQDGSVIPAAGIKRLDGDDTYLVVAADKGTATFSDIANEISTNRNFWLTDAFASGGSNGYDHKKQGITAKGAWESVKRHLHEVGVNPEKGTITAVGIGDMAGDVFGNGLLRSRTVKLLAAFNHLYIFLDPSPDAARSFAERQRLFDSSGNWDVYEKALISNGGGVFDRSSRKIELSPEVREALSIKQTTLSGEDLIKAILRAPVDLLWNGGIGTYVKATGETHFQAGDPSNDRVRIDAGELRAKVVGEGGNLGLTQAARVEAAENGVRLNTDAIDNSAGVNMSDHEVNLKILLDILLRKKVLSSVMERNKIIRKYEPDEIKLVLAQNYINNLALSLDARRMPSQFIYFRALINFLNRKGLFERKKDCIPFEADLDRLEQGSRALSRPVLCALFGFTKLYGTQLFMQAEHFNDPWYNRFILRYFPAEVSRKYEAHILKHPLKREIVITEIVNEIINNAGLAFFQRMLMATGKPLTQIAETYLHLSEFLGLQTLRTAIHSSNEWLHASIHYEYLIFLEEKVYQTVKKILQHDIQLSLLNERKSKQFAGMLQEAAKHSSYRLPRKLHITFKILSEQHADQIMNAFGKADTLEDTFNIFVNNEMRSEKWHVVEYFAILQQFRIKELRQIIKDIKARSSWEVLFFSKIDAEIERLIANLIRVRSEKAGAELTACRQKTRAMLNEITELHARRNLGLAAYFEMLEHINKRILT